MSKRAGIEGSVYFPPESGEFSGGSVQDFQEELLRVRMAPPGIINIDNAIASASGFPDKNLTASCINYAEAIVESDLNNRWYVDSEESATAVQGLRKVMISRSSISETSAHQVFFARLSGGHRQVRVAVKPFEDGPSKALNEWTNMKIAENRGLDVFRPLGFLVSGRGFLITERQDGVESMDNSPDWAVVLREPEKHRGMLADIEKLGPVLARVHNRGCYHGDPQLKNLVITQTGSVHLIDWESATFSYEGLWCLSDEDREPEIRRAAVRDLQVLFGSLARSVKDHGVGLLSSLTKQAQFSYFNELILQPYIEERLQIFEENEGSPEEINALAHICEIESGVRDGILSGDFLKINTTDYI